MKLQILLPGEIAVPGTATGKTGTPIAQTTTYERQGNTSLPTAIIDALGRRTEYTYDPSGNVLTVTRLAGTANAVTTTFTYEPTWNQVASVRDPLNHTTSLGYDPSGKLTAVTDPLNHETTFTYNAAGQPLTVTTPAGTTQFGYDQGQVTSITDPAGRTATQFNAERLVTITNPLGHQTRHEYDALTQLKKITGPLGGTTQFGYDPNAFPLQVALTWIVLLVCYLFTEPEKNINWAFGPGEKPQTRMSPRLYFAILMIVIPLCVMTPTHFALSWLFGVGGILR